MGASGVDRNRRWLEAEPHANRHLNPGGAVWSLTFSARSIECMQRSLRPRERKMKTPSHLDLHRRHRIGGVMSGSYKHWRGIWQGFWSRFSGGPHKTRSRCEKILWGGYVGSGADDRCLGHYRLSVISFDCPEPLRLHLIAPVLFPCPASLSRPWWTSCYNRTS